METGEYGGHSTKAALYALKRRKRCAEGGAEQVDVKFFRLGTEGYGAHSKRHPRWALKRRRRRAEGGTKMGEVRLFRLWERGYGAHRTERARYALTRRRRYEEGGSSQGDATVFRLGPGRFRCALRKARSLRANATATARKSLRCAETCDLDAIGGRVYRVCNGQGGFHGTHTTATTHRKQFGAARIDTVAIGDRGVEVRAHSARRARDAQSRRRR